jgi:uncharacterized protein YdcH (DUF465 family)
MEQNDAEEIRKHLMQTSEEYKQLAQQHEQLEARIAEMENDPHFTEQDELEEHRLKKMKLQVKDQMEEMVIRSKAQHV